MMTVKDGRGAQAGGTEPADVGSSRVKGPAKVSPATFASVTLARLMSTGASELSIPLKGLVPHVCHPRSVRPTYAGD